MEKYFESFLWKSRLVVLSAVLISLIPSLAMFFMATIDAAYMISHLTEYPSLVDEERIALRRVTITHVVELIDGYLLAIVLLIFGLGLYELFISKIDEAENASQVLLINSLDDLKARLSKVIVMILIMKFFEHALDMKFHTPIELLAFAGGIALIGLALYLSHAGEKHDDMTEKH